VRDTKAYFAEKNTIKANANGIAAKHVALTQAALSRKTSTN